MAARVVVYCKKCVPHLTVEALRREIDNADLMTLAECLDLPDGEEEAVTAMLRRLRIEAPDAIAGDFRYAEVHWKPKGRPIQIRREDASDAEIEETLGELPPSSSSAGAQRVREHLAETREIVELEMGINDSLDLGATLAEVLAFYIAEEGDGMVWFYHRDFAAPDDRAANILVTE